MSHRMLEDVNLQQIKQLYVVFLCEML